MNIAQIENSVTDLMYSFDEPAFIYDFLLAYNIPKSIIKRLRDGGLNLSKTEGEVLWKKKIFFKASKDADLHLEIDRLQSTPSVVSHQPRFIIATDFEQLLAIDTKNQDSLAIPLFDLAKHFTFFLPLAGMEKAQFKIENPADVKAAEKMAKLYDEINKDNPTTTTAEVHGLNVFLSRLLFCFFAEDTEIFTKGLFTNSIESHTQADGSDLQNYLERLFKVLNTDYPNRRDLPEHLKIFQYVNGGLFREEYPIPQFTYRSRNAIIECGELNWKDINPDIFGSMIQAVVTPEHRGGLGMHYTSVPNIMKVIEPLFLNELYEEFDNNKNQPQKLENLLYRLSRLKIFDPACGSGNFLIIAYKELRFMEIKIIQRLEQLNQAVTGFEEKQLALIPKAQQSLAAMYQRKLFSNIQLTQFYGIELDDFAHEVAMLSLWLAQHQMNMKFKEEFGQSNPTLPLKDGGNITHGNAAILNWETICSKKQGDEIFILGNPPYLGSSLQSAEQKADMALVFKGFKNYKNLDYIACWFIKAANYITNYNGRYAFVSTNSICQGEQVSLIWPYLYKKNLECSFAYTSFKWTNNAKANAAVIVIILGIRNNSTQEPKYLFSEDRKLLVKNINPYLAVGENIIVYKRNSPLSQLPEMDYGTKTVDGGFLTLTPQEKDQLLRDSPEAGKFIKRITGSFEFINSVDRFCLWINADDVGEARMIKEIDYRIAQVEKMRLKSKKRATRESSKYPYQFGEIRYVKSDSTIVLPRVSSERRKYIPFGFLNEDHVISDSAQVIYNAAPWIFAVIISRMHMCWVRAVAGKLKTDYRYSSALCYNTFPFPSINEKQKKELAKHTMRIIEERENHSEKTLAQLYSPGKMPVGLADAHNQLDLEIERCYRSKLFDTDEERLEYLFKLYQSMVIEKKQQMGAIFFEGTKSKKAK